MISIFENVQIYPDGKVPEAKAPSDATQPIFGKEGALYFKHGAFCLETQNYPDAINHVSSFHLQFKFNELMEILFVCLFKPNFPNSVVCPGDIYKHEFVYKLSAMNDTTQQSIQKPLQAKC